MNETIELIESRFSVRVFDKEPVPEETVRELKRLTLRAPSAGNMQLYSILEVKDQGKKEALAKLCDNQPMIARAPLVWLFLADNHKWERYFLLSESDRKTGQPLRKAGLGDLHLTLQDAVIAAQNCAAAAQALGLGSCYVGDVIENGEEMVKLFKLPPHVIPACLLIMGRPAQKKAKEDLSPRPDITSSIFMEDSYEEPALERLDEQYEGHKAYFTKHHRIPKGELTNTADYYYNRKYTSAFMDEMNRSMGFYIRRYLSEDALDDGLDEGEEGTED